MKTTKQGTKTTKSKVHPLIKNYPVAQVAKALKKYAGIWENKNFTILAISDISLLNEAHSITKKTLDKEWNTPQQDEVWNKFFAGQ